MAVSDTAGQLLGRQRERDVLERLLEAAHEGHGGVLVVYGQPGVGKTALLEYAVETAREFRIARTVGVEGEMELAYTALQQLCSPTLELIDLLPDPQRGALAVAFGLSDGPAPNPFLVGLAVLGLLSEAAEERPLLCVVDDAQWLDRGSARALAFVVRRLLAEKIALLFAAREPVDALAGLPELRVGPLGHRDSHELLESALPARLDEQVLERIIVETRGNPLALLELPRGLTPAQLAGGFGLPAALPLSDQIEESFARRLARLPRDARRLLLLAAAEPVGDLALVWRTAPDSGSPSRRRRRSSRPVSCRSMAVWCSVIHSLALRSTAPRGPTSGVRFTAHSPRRPIRTSTRIAEPGTERRRPRCPTRTLPRSSSAPQLEPRRGVVSPQPQRSSSAPPC
jgi:AAA ATPase domain